MLLIVASRSLPEVHRKSTGSDFELVSALRAAGDPLHLMAAEALANWRTTAERLQERVHQLEAIARLNGETILAMQEAAREEEADFAKRRQRLLSAAKGA